MADNQKQAEDKSLSRLNKQVNQTIEISEVLAGRKTMGGRLGKKLKDQQVQEASITKGKQLRKTKFKEFDNYLERMEYIANDPTGKKKVTIRRALIQDPKNPDKTI